MLSPFSKKKAAFDNCFVLIMRIDQSKFDDTLQSVLFREYHIKVFNTGKIEIPGIQCLPLLHHILDSLLLVLRPVTSPTLQYNLDSFENILLNTDFNCNFTVDREKLATLLKTKYNIHTNYDPCSYPGTKSKFYYDTTKEIQTGCGVGQLAKRKKKSKTIIRLSFMVFRTGNVLISGKCADSVLLSVHAFISKLLQTEYSSICQDVNHPTVTTTKNIKPYKQPKRQYIKTLYL